MNRVAWQIRKRHEKLSLSLCLAYDIIVRCQLVWFGSCRVGRRKGNHCIDNGVRGVELWSGVDSCDTERVYTNATGDLVWVGNEKIGQPFDEDNILLGRPRGTCSFDRRCFMPYQ